jgi:predicted phosphodiesterase
MRYLILSDIHSNKEALTAVLSRVKRKRWDRAIFLGDLVGYAAHPNQVVDQLRRLKPLVAIRGNHDKVCSGIESGEFFNPPAREAAMWTHRKLTRANLRWLRELPRGPKLVDDAFGIAHGTPVDEDAYVFTEIDALNVFRLTSFEICFFGHTHYPVIYMLTPDAMNTVLTSGTTFRFELKPGARYLVNPGSVGQPRDGRPLAAYAIYDSTTRILTIHRAAYRIAKTQQAIYDAGLPRPLAARLAIGR